MEAFSLNEAPEYEKFFDIIDGLNENTEESNQIKEPITKIKDSTYKTNKLRLINGSPQKNYPRTNCFPL